MDKFQRVGILLICSNNPTGKMKEIKKQILPDQVIETFKDGKNIKLS